MRYIYASLLGGLFSMAGCGGDPTIYGPCLPEEIRAGTCKDPVDAGAGDANDAGGDGGSGGSGGGATSACAGDCVPPAPLGWFGPALLWYGPPDQATDCPIAAP